MPKVEGTTRARSTTVLINHLETANVGSWICGVMTFTKMIPKEKFRESIIDEKLLTYSRMRSKVVVKSKSKLEFVPVEVDYDYHINYVFDPEGEEEWGKDQVDEFISSLNGHPMDSEKPLWKVFIIPKLKDTGQSDVVLYLSHVLGDGLSFIDVLLSMFAKPEEKEKISVKKNFKAPSLPVHKKASAFMGGVRHGLFSSLYKRDPKNILLLPDYRVSSPKKLVGTTDPIPLDDLKNFRVILREKHKIFATLNDIIMLLLNNSLKSFYKEKGETPKRVTCSFPISTRGKGQTVLYKDNPTNMFAYGVFVFDFKSKDCLTCLRKIKAQTDKIKNSPSPYIQNYQAAAVMKVAPMKTILKTVQKVANTSTLQLSNIPGPQSQLFLGDIALDDMRFFLFAPFGLYIGILSYNGKVHVSINMDSELGVKPSEIINHWMAEFENLKELLVK